MRPLLYQTRPQVLVLREGGPWLGGALRSPAGKSLIDRSVDDQTECRRGGSVAVIVEG